jgi:mevalonate kinase
MDQFGLFLRVMEALAKADVDYILIGGYAVIIHGFPRFTQDVDIYVKMEQENISRLRLALDDVFHDESLQEITFEEIESFPVIRYGSPDGFVIDIIGKLGEASSFDDLDYESVEVEGKIIRVATPETLYRLKSGTVRPKDQQDAGFLCSLIERRKAINK